MSERNNDRSGRWRNRTVAFRVSEEEARQLDMLVSISGLTKQDYITSKLLDRRVTVEPSSRIQRNLAGVMREVLAELEQVAKLHLALVYRGTADGARQFIEAQDALIEELYAEPEEDPIEEGEAADPAAATPESEVTG